MSLLDFAFLLFIGQPLLLAAGYVVGIQYLRGGILLLLGAVAAIALVIDTLANLTVFSVYFWELPQIRTHGEWTFSTRLERLFYDTGWRGALARPIALMLNRIDPTHSHIKAASLFSSQAQE